MCVQFTIRGVYSNSEMQDFIKVISHVLVAIARKEMLVGSVGNDAGFVGDLNESC